MTEPNDENTDKNPEEDADRAADPSKRITIDELEERLAANPRFNKAEPNEDETTFTFLSAEAAEAFKKQRDK